ncbi:MAG: 5'/3'-nucleotidase SurE [Armatimonadetes bacterium]|nr:5'/3'-nucleotidase SurE [Armatimonadota bacterium]
MRVLVTNDDGINSAGLHALVRTLEPETETYEVAPEHERSATGHAITLHKPLRAVPATLPGSRIKGWATNGTPADCVALGVLELLPGRPDVVISGINVGPNLGRDLTYSGTVSGAMEGAIFRIASIAVSVGAFRDTIFDVAAAFALRLVRQVAERGLPEDTLLNVNVPNLPKEQIKGVKLTRQGEKRYVSRLDKRTDPRGRAYYWLTGEPAPQQDVEGTDSWALAQGYISVTPIRLNMTDPEALARLTGWRLAID